MTKRILNEADQEELVSAVKQAFALVDQGLTPTDAIVKIARERQYKPGAIETLSYAYNTGRQTEQRESSKTALDKLAAFPLADPETAISQIYGETKEASIDPDYSRSPTWLRSAAPPPTTIKAASAAALVMPATPPADPSFALRRAQGEIARLKLAENLAGDAVLEAHDRLSGATKKLAAYFRKHAWERRSIADVEHAARAYSGQPEAAVTKLFDHVTSNLRTAEKRAADALPSALLVDMRAEPFCLVAPCIKAAQELHQRSAAYAEAKTAHAKAKEELLRPFPGADSTSKQAGLLQAPAVGTALGLMMTQGLAQPKTTDQLVEKNWTELDDPEHQNELRKIKAMTMINGLMTDPDDPISGYEPNRVLSAYNEMASMAPRVAEQPAAIGPLLRRRLAGNVEPFEAKELAGMEKELAASRGGLNLVPGSR